MSQVIRALLLPKYGRQAASARHRLLQYVPVLAANGFHCEVRPFLQDEYLAWKFETGKPSYAIAARAYIRRMAALLESSRYDLLVVHCELLPYLPEWFERVLMPRRIPYVLDFDDAIFLQYTETASRMVRWFCGEKMRKVFAGASLVLAGNEYLAEYARQTANWVEILPTVVDLERYPSTQRPVSPTSFTLGWIGSPSTAPYLVQIAPSLKDVCATGGGCRFVVVGAGRFDLPDINIERREWSEATEVDEICRFDVGLMPLPDTPWAQGKCGFKLIQYMACGVPVVASPVGVNTKIVAEGECGFLSNDRAGWTNALHTLRRDPAMRGEMGRAGRKHVERFYSLEAVGPRVVTLLRQAAGNHSSTLK